MVRLCLVVNSVVMIISYWLCLLVVCGCFDGDVCCLLGVWVLLVALFLLF